MIKVESSYNVIDKLDGEAILKKIEYCGRVCYQSYDNMTDESAKEFVARLIRMGHESVLEHFSFTVEFVIDRGISHEAVRHRISSFSQESTRYVKYKSDIECIVPCQIKDGRVEHIFEEAYKKCEEVYHTLINCGVSPQNARAVLPHGLKTKLIMSGNLRQWRTVLKQRTAKGAHPDMIKVMGGLLKELKEKVPVIFDDIN